MSLTSPLNSNLVCVGLHFSTKWNIRTQANLVSFSLTDLCWNFLLSLQNLGF